MILPVLIYNGYFLFFGEKNQGYDSNHTVMLMKNVANPDGKMIDLTNMKILSNSVDDTKRFDSTQVFLDRYSVE
jgi:hypothetical protein